ncbi:haloacid dehalogenase [Actinoplanes sp. ATCC 53533]|uniref:D-glycero-alpha-D-manno-heptose-1,7-bisphosphate 7-phosphatase n=1 Tax=Actinoplanes sp. ATCC 53533 TaxID=1288362 RepID=UPI000F782B2A|nr:haloacid dehalogenase [Actinoplanes sp. ATCC 53533]
MTDDTRSPLHRPVGHHADHAGDEHTATGPRQQTEGNAAAGPIETVLLDRDGTLIIDVPYNGDPSLVEAMPAARSALDRLRAAGLTLGVVTNQSGLARGLITEDQVAAVNARVTALLGPFATWQICPHDDAARCRCRKPRPGLVHDAAAALGETPRRCVVLGDRLRDVAAGSAAGASGILIPTASTPHADIRAASTVAVSLHAAADLIIARRQPPTGRRNSRSPDRLSTYAVLS